MSLLDDVSIVVTPNGYKAGTLFAFKPTDVLGAEEVTNGDFATDSDWTKSSGTTISGGVASIVVTSGGYQSISQSLTYISGKSYTLKATINGTSGKACTFFDAAGNNGGLSTSNGVVTFNGAEQFIDITFVANGNSNTILVARNGSGDYSFTLDNVSVKEYTAADMDVTRATAATRVDEAGLVNYAEVILDTQLVTNGDFASGTTGWSAYQGSLSVSNGNLVVTATANSDTRVRTQIATVVGKSYILTAELKSMSGTKVGVANANNSFSYSGNVQELTSTGSYSYYFTAAYTNTSIVFKMFGASTGETFSLDNVSVKEVTRDNVPRIDYSGGGCPHILAEPQRTNLLTYSEDLTDTYWSKLDGLIASSLAGGLSPDGLTNSDLITINNGRLNKDISVSNSTAYTLTAYFKGTVGETINMDLGASTKLITLTGLWQRESINLTTTSTFIAVNLIDNRSSGTASTVEVWGAQLEEGSYATSYIPTSGSTVTRNQDIFTRDGIGSLINSTEGVLFVESIALSDNEDTRISISDGTGNNFISIGYSRFSGNIIAEIFAGGVLQTVGWGANGVNKLINHKFALSWGSGTMNFYMDGSISNTESVTSPTGLNRLALDNGSGTQDFFGKLKQLQVYKTALTDAQLTSLTS